jgi:hypothetical protein
MAKGLCVIVSVIGLGVIGCAQSSDGLDKQATPIPESSLIFARVAVEVGQIKIAQMPEFRVTVDGMDVDQRTELWLSLKQLHDAEHADEAIAHEAVSTEPLAEEAGGCTILPCSHSAWSLTAQWCCALGQNRMFYASDI